MTVASAERAARPVILIPPTQVPADDDIRLAQNYTDAVVRAGGAPVILPLTADARVYDTLFALADGVLLTGGHDVDPARYGCAVPDTAGEKNGRADAPSAGEPEREPNAANEKDEAAGIDSETGGNDEADGAAAPSKSAQRLGAAGDLTPLRDEVEYRLLDYAFAHNLPVYGICRGIQLLNVYLGGTLWQDLPTGHEPYRAPWDKNAPAPCDLMEHNLHKENGDYDGDSYAHTVGVDPASRTAQVFACAEGEPLPVNSLHHQAVRAVAPDLKATAVAPDGVIEAVEHRTRPHVLAVQWHPEYFARSAEKDDGHMGRFFTALVEAARVAQAHKAPAQR